MQFAGDDLPPAGTGARPPPYIAKIKASGADSVITGNWGSTCLLLIKAANDGGLNNVKFSTPTTAPSRAAPPPWAPPLRAACVRVAYAHMNMGGPDPDKIIAGQQEKFNDDMSRSSDLPRLHHAF